ncbi:alpha/beta fold hydrolase [Ferrovibrio xuzhouensis]|uniref:Alpha/beta fold hydrolase n=1 Tax=Ferrovibrio xuzhouensis TaxID=1576914 RepID=A0ABV7VMK2_9PROT
MVELKPTLVSADYSAPSGTGAGALYLKRKRAQKLADATPIVLLHGSTLPGSAVFDLQLDGLSWMDDLASTGRDVWCLDLSGYGRSDKPVPRRLADGTEVPVTDTEEALADLATCISYVLSESEADQIDLVGWSWGATISAAFCSRPPHAVRSLILYAPQWLRDTPSPMVTPGAMEKGYREVDPEKLVDRWFKGLKPAIQAEVKSKGWPMALIASLAACDLESQVIQAPNGTIKDIGRYWMAGKPFYDPGNITIPTLVIVGSDDQDTPPAQGQAIHARLGAQSKTFVEILDGTHFMLLEPSRVELFNAVRAFLAVPE